MPELPEVETIANGVHARVRGQTIQAVWTSGKPQTFKSPESEIAEALTGAEIAGVERVGKTIVMTLGRAIDGGAASLRAQFLIHLGMTGRLLVSAPEVPLPPHTHAVLSLSGGSELRFVDARRFGRLSLFRADSEVPLPSLPEAGPERSSEASQPGMGGGQSRYRGPGTEPLTISEPDFFRLFRGRRTPIKAALLNQSLLHGVGNIYADESLFRAGIRPRRSAARLTRTELRRLRSSLEEVLRHAIKLGGSSVSDYVDADGVRGFFQLEHRVYMRTGKPCFACATPIKKIIIGGRSTHFCPICQR